MIALVDVYGHPGSEEHLYALLLEREEHVNISHRECPTWEQHVAFVAKRPYRHWWLIVSEEDVFGACYLTNANEIGIFVFRDHRRQGIARDTLKQVRSMFPGERLLANINPDNAISIALFSGLGFHHIQNTFALEIAA